MNNVVTYYVNNYLHEVCHMIEAVHDLPLDPFGAKELLQLIECASLCCTCATEQQLMVSCNQVDQI